MDGVEFSTTIAGDLSGTDKLAFSWEIHIGVRTAAVICMMHFSGVTQRVPLTD